MDREPEYFKKKLSRNQLDKVIYGLYETVRDEVDKDIPITVILSQAYKSSNFKYEGIKPKRLANYLTVRRLLLDSGTKLAVKVVKKADNQMLGEISNDPP